MGRIQSSVGLITGTDIVGTVDQLMAINGQPRDRLVNRTSLLQSEQGSIAELTASVIGVQLAGNRLANISTFRSKDATSSNSDSLSAVAGTGAEAGSHVVRTIQTAATHAVSSRQRQTSDTEALGYAGTLTIGNGGQLDQSLDVSKLNNGRGVEAGKIRITDRSGASADVDLSRVKTIDDVLTAINDAGVDVRATTVDGKIKLTDQTGQTASNLIVEQLGTAETAADLGLWGIDAASNTATGFDLTFDVSAATDLSQLREGKGVRLADGDDLTVALADGTTFDVDFADFGGEAEPTIQDVLDQLNGLDPAKLSAAFTSKGIEVTDLTTGSNSFSIADAAGSNTASDLRLVGTTTSDKITAEYKPQVLRGTSLDELAGGSGISGLTSLDITTADGTSGSIDLSSAGNTAEIIDAINDAGLDIIVRLNDSGDGLRIRDVSGGSGNLQISSADDTASALGIAADTEDDIVVGKSLGRQVVNSNTELTSLNQGIGIDIGSFTITDSAGEISAINLATDSISTIGDLVNKINGLSVNVTASLNEAGDGIAIVDNAGGAGTLAIVDTGDGTAAKDLGVAGEATTQTINGSSVSALVGSQSDRITIEATDSLASIVDKINQSKRYAKASVEVNDDGSFSLRLRSNQGGAAGRFGVNTEGFNLDLNTVAKAQDAIIAVSTDGGSERLLSSSDGVFDINGVGEESSAVTSATLLSSLSSTATSGSFTIKDSSGQTSAINLTVAGITTVGGLVDRINSLGIGVQASVNDDATGITITDMAGGDDPLTIADVGNGTAAASLGFAGEADDLTLTGTGVASTSTDATGLTFTLKEISAELITVNVEEDSSAVEGAAQTFVNQYNNLVDKLDSLTFFNADTNEVGLLFGSSEAQRIRTGYNRLLSGTITGAGSIRSVGQVGIKLNSEGKLDLNSTKLAEAVDENRSDVEAFFTTDTNGLADRLSTLADTIAGAESSLLINRTETLGTQIQRNNLQVETLNERLDKQRERLLLQYYRSEEAISKIQSNSISLDQIQRITIPT